MKFRVALVVMMCGLMLTAIAQNKSTTGDKPAKPTVIIDTAEYFASPYGKDVKPAAYPGGLESFSVFLAQHMVLPVNLTVSVTRNGKVTDSLYASFEIEKNGTVS